MLLLRRGKLVTVLKRNLFSNNPDFPQSNKGIGSSKGSPGMRAPPSNFLHFHTVFGGNWAK